MRARAGLKFFHTHTHAAAVAGLAKASLFLWPSFLTTTRRPDASAPLGFFPHRAPNLFPPLPLPTAVNSYISACNGCGFCESRVDLTDETAFSFSILAFLC